MIGKTSFVRLPFFVRYTGKNNRGKKSTGSIEKNRFGIGVFKERRVYMKIYPGSKRHAVAINC